MLLFKTEIHDFTIPDYSLVTLKTMGHIYEVDKDHYMNLKTGEVFDCNHIENRSQNKFQVGQSLKRLRDYINTNVTDVSCCRWITLTYAENMTDTKRLYVDFKRFMTRLKRRFTNYHIEYIVACEPQARGAWHMHLILIFNKPAPYVPNSLIESLWSQGFTKTTKLDDIDNIGAYLTAYLGDMELNNENIHELAKNGLDPLKMPIKEVSSIEGINLKKPKSFIKGGRLYLYPPNFNLYRVSRGIKMPVKEVLPYSLAKQKAGLRLPTYSKGFHVSSIDNSFTNEFVYEYYNTKLKEINNDSV